MLTMPHRQRAAKPEHQQSWLRRRSLLRFEIGVIAAFHWTVTAILLLAPRERIVTPSTRAIFGTIPVEVWVLLFAATATTATLAVLRATDLRLWLTWAGVGSIGPAWIFGFAVELHGQGNPLFPLLWTVALTWWTLTALRLHLGGDEARWGGR